MSVAITGATHPITHCTGTIYRRADGQWQFDDGTIVTEHGELPRDPDREARTMTIHTHATTKAAPLSERIASIRREAKGRQKKPASTAPERWDCGNAEHKHPTRQSALDCIDSVLPPLKPKPGGYTPPPPETLTDREREIIYGTGDLDAPVGILQNPAKIP